MEQSLPAFESNETTHNKAKQEARQKSLIYRQIQDLKKRQLNGLSLEQAICADIDSRIKGLQEQLRFNSPLAFLYFEKTIGFTTIGQIKDHIATGLVCPRRIHFICSYVGVNLDEISDDSPIDGLILNPNVQQMSNQEKLIREWCKYEFEANKWISYSNAKYEK